MIDDYRAPIATLRDELRVSEALHQYDPRTCDVGSVPPGSVAPGAPQSNTTSTLAELAKQTAPEPPKVPPEPVSIVVLPFSNLSGDPAQDYVADVITDELTTSLSRIVGSLVIARSTAFTYKGKAIDAKQIGKELGVRYLLEGSAQPTGNRVRIVAQLISAETGAHLWAEQFDTDRGDLLQMQDEIVTSLTRALEAQIAQIVTMEAVHTARARPFFGLIVPRHVLNTFGIAAADCDYQNC
jgi:TolB-like protein